MTVFPAQRRSYVYHTALQAAAAGMSVVPIRSDGTKQPALIGWREYQKRRASTMELEHWFSDSVVGIALITGAVSGNLEALDFDDAGTFEAWLCRIQRTPVLATLYNHIACGYLESTPAGGSHLLYRIETVEGNQKLASKPDGDKRKTLIETRGEGGLIIIAPSHGRVHASGKPYVLQRGDISSIRTITNHERSLLFAVAREFDMLPHSDLSPPPLSKTQPLESRAANSLRPGDLFNQHASWEEVLIPHSWQRVRTNNGEGYWRRPGKRSPGISATTNHNGHDLLYVFSTSTVFEFEKGYTKFRAYALLNHHGNFPAAARALAEQGYTSKKER